MINAIPILGWIVSVCVGISVSVPFWFLWTVCGLGNKYFGFLPSIYLHIPFWNCVGLFVIISIIKAMIMPNNINVNGK